VEDSKIRVLLIEDHQMVREGVAALLSQLGDIEVVGQASDTTVGVDLAMEAKPHVIVMDVNLPGESGIVATRRIKRLNSAVQVLILSMHDDPSTVDQALRAGARGYVVKGQNVHTLAQAIRSVAAGKVYLSPEVSEYVLQGYLSADGPEVDPLTEREREILSLIALGLTATEVAERLGLKPKTVQNHRTNLMEKLGIHSTAGLVRHALRIGLAR
jgi:DNA-binding NarL/FixJ family response regulator